MTAKTLELPPLHAGQHAARKALADARFMVLLTGRQWGKSRYCGWQAMHDALHGRRVWWVSPSHQFSEDAWRLLAYMAKRVPGASVNLGTRTIRFNGGGEVRVRSAVDPDSLRGGTLDLAILDEAAFMPERVWTEIIRPTLAIRKGKAIFASTPRGRNWFYDLYQRGQSGDAEWGSLRFRSVDSPFFSEDEWEEAKRSPVFAQEYNAEPGSGDDGIIPLEFVLAANERWREREAAGTLTEGEYVLGIDVSEGGSGADLTTLAHRHGWSIARIEDATPASRGDMMPIADKAAQAVASLGGYAIVDAVGVGAMLPGALRRQGARCVAYKASAGTKLRDGSGLFGFVNVRSASWWHLRELLSPDGPGIALPPDRDLTAELTAPTYDEVAGSKIRLEAKDAVKKRIGRSPDKADAVVMAFWQRQIMRPRRQA